MSTGLLQVMDLAQVCTRPVADTDLQVSVFMLLQHAWFSVGYKNFGLVSQMSEQTRS